jgi:excisionase family DNA binding protein
MPRLLTTQEVADWLRIERRTVVRMARQDRLPAVRLSRKTLRFDRQAVETAIAGRPGPKPAA